jgi:ABC-type enterochelin transport system ATPase subunit
LVARFAVRERSCRSSTSTDARRAVRAAGDPGKTAAMVLHDSNMAAEHGDHIFVMRDGT